MIKVEKKDARAHALDVLREYIICSSVDINSRGDLMMIYLKMHKEGYFFRAEANNAMPEVKASLKEFSDFYEKDSSILESDLIFYGSKRVIEKMDILKGVQSQSKKIKC